MVSVVHSLGWYFPDSVGGTEVYVRNLIRELREFGVKSWVVAPINSAKAAEYTYDNTPVFRYPICQASSGLEFIDQSEGNDLSDLRPFLSGTLADVYHQHSWTYGCGLPHLRLAKRLGMATVLTVHVPGLICLRGTMLEAGRDPCDGKIGVERCASCWLQFRGLTKSVGGIISRLPAEIGVRFKRFGRIGTAFSAAALATEKHADLLEAAELSDRVVAVCGWLYDALLANGVPQEKLSLNRQGIDPSLYRRNLGTAGARRSKVVIGYLGRWDKLKGIDLLVNALVRLPSKQKVELHIRAPQPTEKDAKLYMQEVLAAAASDPRIKVLGEVLPDEVAGFFRTIDILAVPSRWFETGPLVVLEAFATGTPVIGSDIGGIRELVLHGVNGLLVPFADVDPWVRAFQRILSSDDLLMRLARGIGSVRSMRDVASDTKEIYNAIVDSDVDRAGP